MDATDCLSAVCRYYEADPCRHHNGKGAAQRKGVHVRDSLEKGRWGEACIIANNPSTRPIRNLYLRHSNFAERMERLVDEMMQV